MAQSQLAPQQDPLFLELSGAGLRHILELEPETDRAFLVGASRQADVFIDAPGVAAVEFHLERLGNDVWLTPAYRGHRLLVNGEPVRDRLQVKSGVLLRLGDYELHVKLLSPDEHARTATRTSSAPRPLPNDYSLGLPTDTQQTSLAMAPMTFEAADTAPVVAPRRPSTPLPEQRTERMAPVAVPALGVQATERMAPVVMPMHPVSHASVIGSTETVRMEPVVMPPRQLMPSSQRAPMSPTPVTTPVSTQAAQVSPLATQETTAFDVAALRGGTPDLPPTTPPAPAVPPATTGGIATRKAPPPAPVTASGFKLLLSQLGVATKHRPVIVVGAALAGSFVLALALVGASRLSHPRAAPAVQASTPSKGNATTAAARPDPAPVPSAAAPPSLPHPESQSAPDAAQPPESPARAAVRNLSAGRLAEAAEQYRSAGSQPNSVVYAEVGSLLSRRLSARCTTRTSPENSCPEILK